MDIRLEIENFPKQNEGAAVASATTASANRRNRPERKVAWGRKVVVRGDQSPRSTAPSESVGDPHPARLSDRNNQRELQSHGADSNSTFNFTTDLVYTRPPRNFHPQPEPSKPESNTKHIVFPSARTASPVAASAGLDDLRISPVQGHFKPTTPAPAAIPSDTARQDPPAAGAREQPGPRLQPRLLPPPPSELRSALAALRAADALAASVAADAPPPAADDPLPHDATIEDALRR